MGNKHFNYTSILRCFDLILGIIVILYTIIINRISSVRVVFSTPFMIFGIFIIIYHFSKKKITAFINNSKVLKVFSRIIVIGIIILIGVLCIIEGFIIGYPKNNKERADYVVVLGAGLRNGTELSETLKDRLDAAIAVIGKDDYIVVSGGMGTDEKISEAEAMKRYLVECGIDEKRIIEEDKSINTIQNLKYSKDKIEQNAEKSINECKVKIVTTDFHACRAAYIAEKNNYKYFTIYTSKSLNYLIPIYYARESFAMIKTILTF